MYNDKKKIQTNCSFLFAFVTIIYRRIDFLIRHMVTSDSILDQRETFNFLVAVSRSNLRFEMLFQKVRYNFLIDQLILR